MLRVSKRTLRAWLAGALALCAAAPVAQASSGGATVIPVDTSWKGTNGVQNVVCTSPVGTCELYYTSQLTYSGTWQGTSFVYGHGHFDQNGDFPFTETVSFSGTVGGCGSGSFK